MSKLDQLFIILVLVMVFAIGALSGHEIGFINGQDYQKKVQGYKFDNVPMAFKPKPNNN